MANRESAGAEYDEARQSFDDLEMEEQTRFLVEATASTLAQGLQQAGEALADGLEDVIRRARQRSGGARSGGHPGAAEPETSQRRASRVKGDE